MPYGLRTRAQSIALVVALLIAASILAWAGAATPAGADAGAQPPPTLNPAPVTAAATGFAFQVPGGAHCDGTGAQQWRAQTFIVDDDVAVGSLDFTGADAGGNPGYVGVDFDASDGSIRAPLYKGGEPAVDIIPANTPAGLLAPEVLGSFTFGGSHWVLADGNYKIGFACLDQTAAVKQWWSLNVTIDADSTTSFMVVNGSITDTSVVVTASPASGATAGDSVTFTAAVTPSTVAGSVEFLVDGTAQSTVAVSNGTATWTTSDLTVGTKSVTAKFTPIDTAAFGPSTSTALSYDMAAKTAKTTSVALTAGPQSQANEGDEVTLTATVTPSDAAGKVTFKAGGVALGAAVTVNNGVATLKTKELDAGDLTLTASFAPDDLDDFKASTGTLSYKVVGTAGETTTLTLSVEPASTAAAGQTVTLKATVTPAAAKGVVVFTRITESTDGTADLTVNLKEVALAEGAATLTVSDLPVGSHELSAAFVPDDANVHKASTATAVTFTVTGASTQSSTTSTTSNPSNDTSVLNASSGPTSALARTGQGLGLAVLGLLFVYVGRCAYLLARPGNASAPR